MPYTTKCYGVKTTVTVSKENEDVLGFKMLAMPLKIQQQNIIFIRCLISSRDSAVASSPGWVDGAGPRRVEDKGGDATALLYKPHHRGYKADASTIL